MTEVKKKDPKQLTTPEGRLSHPHLFKASAIPGTDNKSYSCELLLPKATTPIAVIKAPIHAAIVQKWGADKDEWPIGMKMPYRDGDIPKLNKKTKKKEVKKEYKGMWVVRASTKEDLGQPPVVSTKRIGGPKGKLEQLGEGDVYPGCYVRLSLFALAYEFSETSTGVKFILDSVQKTKDGESLGGRPNVEETFGAFAVDVDEEETEFQDFGDEPNEEDAETDEDEF